MGGEILVVGIFLWILLRHEHSFPTAEAILYLFRSHEEQMLHGMGHPRHVIRITEATHLDIDRRARFIGVWIMHQKGLELV